MELTQEGLSRLLAVPGKLQLWGFLPGALSSKAKGVERITCLSCVPLGSTYLPERLRSSDLLSPTLR